MKLCEELHWRGRSAALVVSFVDGNKLLLWLFSCCEANERRRARPVVPSGLDVALGKRPC